MDRGQSFAYNLAKEGHNLVICGQAGSGKTYLLQKITRGLRAEDKNVYVTCSTGIAATKYSDLGGTTLHKWAGIADGRFLNAEILHLINTDERYQEVKQCIVSADCLIVDEVSMISAKTLNQVEFLCRSIRESPYKFGGMQVILAGDFYQLPPRT